MTSAPASAKSLTAAAPIPREPPVMSAALPASEIMIPPRDLRKQKPVAIDSSFLHRTTARRGNKILEQRLGKSVTRHTFRMPLNADHPIGIPGPLHAFDDSIRSFGRHTKVFSGSLNGLVVAAINPGHRSLI